MKSKFVQSIAILFLLLPLVPIGMRLGEGPLLSTAGLHLGISHPPGYPFYLHFVKLITLVPLGNIAYRCSLLSVLMGVCIFWIYLPLFREMSGRLFFIGFYILLLLPTFLDSLLKTEVYALNLIFFGLFLRCWLHWQRACEFRWIVFFSFLYGLSIGHHLTLIVVLPVFIFSGLSLHRRMPKQLIFLPILFFLAGLSIWMYLPIRSAGHPLVNWGNSATFGNFLNLVTASDEAIPSIMDTFRLLSWETLLSRFHNLFVSEFSWIFILLSAYGCYRCFRDDKGRATVLLSIVLLFFISVMLYHSNESSSFFLPAFTICCLWMAAGLSAISRNIHAALERFASRKQLDSRRTALLTAVLVLVLCTLVLFGQAEHIAPFFQGTSTIDLTLFGRGLISDTSENAYILTDHSNLYFLLLYQQYCEMIGADRYIIFRHLLSYPWYITSQYSGIFPVEADFDIQKNVQNTVVWNETVSAAIILAAHKQLSVHLLEPALFRKYQSSFFSNLKLVPNGFSFVVTEKEYTDLRLSLFYRWFVNYTLENSLNPFNSDLYYYLHTLQYTGHRQLGAKELSIQEANWMALQRTRDLPR